MIKDDSILDVLNQFNADNDRSSNSTVIGKRQLNKLMKNGLLNDTFSQGISVTPNNLMVPNNAYVNYVQNELLKSIQKNNNENVIEAIARKSSALSFYDISQSTGYGITKQWHPNLDFLRQIAKRVFIIAAIHATRRKQFQALLKPSRHKYDLGFDIVHKNYKDPMFTPGEDLIQRCDIIREIFERPYPLYDKNFTAFGVKLLKDHMTLDRACFEKLRDSQGRIAQLVAVDGATILPRVEVIMKYMSNKGIKDPYIAMRGIETETGEDITNAMYVQVRDGIISAAFSVDELAVGIENPTTELGMYGYGQSMVEESVHGVLAWLNAFNLNHLQFTQGNWTDGFLALIGDFDQRMMNALQERVHMEAMTMKNAWKWPMLPLETADDAKWISTRQSNKEMLFDHWMSILASLICAIYRMDPKEINLESRVEASTINFEKSKATELKDAKKEGFGAILNFFSQMFNDEVVIPRDPDLRFIWVGLDMKDEVTMVDIHERRSRSYKGINETRMEDGLKKYDFQALLNHPEKVDDVIANPVVFQWIDLINRAREINLYQQPQGVNYYPEQLPENAQPTDGISGESNLPVMQGEKRIAQKSMGGLINPMKRIHITIKKET